MIVAQLVQARISRTIPNSAPNLFAGQALSRANSPVTSTAGSPTVLGIYSKAKLCFLGSKRLALKPGKQVTLVRF